ncbi:ribonuclease 3-like [Phragmites australis]|uniref:ribonuclease 3-like n=1 Tax=Phragmites australis TaxID=29695 RepID=UPI002D7A110D|nr:ribonuclease 3-like [Phragmites australis]
MKLALSFALLLSLVLAVSSTAEEFDFFYLVQQWPGSFCDTEQGCCFPSTGKPAADFGIHGLWPNYAVCRTGGEPDAEFSIVGARKKCWPEYCNDDNPLSLLEIKDLLKPLDRNWPSLSCKNGGQSMRFWSYEWRKHGTCSGLDQHDYFEAALALKSRHNLTAILASAGIVPSDSRTYFLSSIRDAISDATGFAVNLECNRDESSEAQLFQVYQCVDRDGKELIDCTLPMRSKCTDRVKLPSF